MLLTYCDSFKGKQFRNPLSMIILSKLHYIGQTNIFDGV